MIDPRQAEDLARVVRDLYAAAEDRAIAAVATRLARGIDEPGWAVRKQAEARAMRAELDQLVTQLDARALEATEQLVAQAQLAGRGAGLEDLRAAGLDASFSGGSPTALRSIARETVTQLRSTHFAILRQTSDVFRSVVAEGSGLGITGAITRRQAAQLALERFADRGIAGFVDDRGRRWQLDSYAEMATRTAMGRAHLQGRAEVLTTHGKDLVMLSDSFEECPWCRPWEGRIVSLSGTNPGYPSLASAQAAGWGHPNCTHSWSAYVPGLSQPSSDANPVGYAERQEQRYLERNVRRWKRRQAVAITEASRRQARAKLRAWQARSRGFTDRTGRRRRYDRESIGGARPTPPVYRDFATAQEADAWARDVWGGALADLTPTERRALEDYTTSGYEAANRLLRGRPLEEEDLDERWPTSARIRSRLIHPIDRAIARTVVPDDIIVRRGLWVEHLEDSPFGTLDYRSTVGQRFTDPGFFSTSVGPARRSGDPLQMTIRVPRGTPAVYLEPVTQIRGERELLLRRGVSWSVLSAEKRGQAWHLEIQIERAN